jgi:hypothetical protein
VKVSNLEADHLRRLFAAYRELSQDAQHALRVIVMNDQIERLGAEAGMRRILEELYTACDVYQFERKETP